MTGQTDASTTNKRTRGTLFSFFGNHQQRRRTGYRAESASETEPQHENVPIPAINNNESGQECDEAEETNAVAQDQQQEDRGIHEEDTWDDPNLCENVHDHGRKSTGIVKDQKAHVMTNAFQSRARKDLRDGKFWTTAKYVQHKDATDLRKCWPKFFEMDVFNWIPSEFMPKNWNPVCPKCGNTCVKNGCSKEPRVIFGLHENYLLNAPQRYKCNACQKISSEEERRNIPKVERTQWSWLSTDVSILDQIQSYNQGLMNEFPCVLSEINGLDKELMDLCISLATKSIGPASLSDIIASFHDQRWNEKEIAWVAHLKNRSATPTLQDQFSQIHQKRHEIEKCPSYYSKELCGSIPSRGYLCLMFNRYIAARRRYMDAEVVKCCRTSRLICLDASYKVGKYLMKHGDEKMYDTLHTMLNEYGQIVQQKWSNGDSHDELEQNLKDLNHIGLDPIIAFSDDPQRDRSLLMRVFPRLAEDVDDEKYGTARIEAQACGLDILPTRGEYSYIYRAESGVVALADLFDRLSACSENSKKVISIDAEWPVYIHDVTRVQGKLNLLIITSNVIPTTYIFELYSIGGNSEFGNYLQRLFSRQDVVFTGCCHKGDLTRLRNGYPHWSIPEIPNDLMVDVREMAISRGFATRGLGNTTLSALCQKAGKYLPKDDDIRVGTIFDSKNGSLSHNKIALSYMHRDGEANLFLYNLLAPMPILTRRMSENELNIGQIVEIMSSSVEDLNPIAIGKVVQMNGTTRSAINLSVGATSKRCLIKILEICRPDGIIHFPRTEDGSTRCACRRFEHGKIKDGCDFYRYSSFPKEKNFSVVETVNRLRLHSDQSWVCTDEEGEDEHIETNGGIPRMDGRVDTQVDENGNAPNEDLGVEDENLVRNTDQDEAAKEAEREVINELENEEDLEHDINDTLLSALHLDETEANRIDEELVAFPGCHDDGVQDTDDAVAESNGSFTSNEIEDEQLTSQELNERNHSARAVQIAYASPIEKLISDADNFNYGKECCNCNFLDEDGDESDDNAFPHRLRELNYLTKVIGDAFHVMDRVKVPMHHDFKPAFFRALRAAVFILNPSDVKNLCDVLRLSDRKWKQMLAFNFKYIAKRVRRRIPTPEMLYHRLKVVFEYFKDKKDSKTNKPLFNDAARKKAQAVLVMVKSGLLSDPFGYSFYVKRFNRDGSPMVDKNGLQLYRSIRGTSILESLHQMLSKCFGHTLAGAWYSDSLLTLIRHCHNWRASLRNDKSFPQLRHYNGILIDTVNELYEDVFGRPKYRMWKSTNDILATINLHDSPFGIARIKSATIEGESIIDVEVEQPPPNSVQTHKMTFTSNEYIAFRQRTDVAYLPCKGETENFLFREILLEAIRNEESLSASNTFVRMADAWNQRAKGKENGIYKKLPVHLARRYKKWRKSKSKEEAIKSPLTTELLNAIEYTPKSQDSTAENRDEFVDNLRTVNTTQESTAGENDDRQGAVVDSLSDAGNNATTLLNAVNNVDTGESTVRNRFKKCDIPGCVYERCPYKYSKKCLYLIHVGRQSKDTKLKKKGGHKRCCKNCKERGCPGHSNRSKCRKLTGA